MNEILYGDKTEFVEDYYEILNAKISFSFEDASSILEDDKLASNYNEMKKVFFTNQPNKFGHNYAGAVKSPLADSVSIVEDIVTLLKKNPSTRKAILTYMPYGNEKVPCINCIHFTVRNNKLNISYFARGQDIYYKFPLDAMCIIEMGNQVAEKLNIKTGSINANITSAHIYDIDVEKAKQYCIENHKIPTIILSGNGEKYAMFKKELDAHGFSLLISKLNIPEIQDVDCAAVAKAKAKAAYELLGFSVWVDDVYLITEVFDNFPGPLTKYVLNSIGIDGLRALFNGKSKRATMVCAMACFDGFSYHYVEGKCEGVFDFDKTVNNTRMPLDSIFICDSVMKHRRDALNNVFNQR